MKFILPNPFNIATTIKYRELKRTRNEVILSNAPTSGFLNTYVDRKSTKKNKVNDISPPTPILNNKATMFDLQIFINLPSDEYLDKKRVKA